MIKILKLIPKLDTPSRYNYQINYGIWDKINGDILLLQKFNLDILNNYDIVFLPMYKRWDNHYELLNRIKEHKIKTVLFDNDCYHRSFNIEFYRNIDLIFYRMLDKNNNIPEHTQNMNLKWSIDTELYTPNYGGFGVSFNCGINNLYKLRQQTASVIPKTTYKGIKYIKHLQEKAAAIHISSHIINIVQAKILEFAACGTQIISDKVINMDDYFPHDLIIYFNTIDELKHLYYNFEPDIKTQKKLRQICVEKHDDKIRAKQVLNKIKEIL